MVWLPKSEKISKICLFVLTECTNVTDTQTDTQTLHDGIGHACIAARCINRPILMKFVVLQHILILMIVQYEGIIEFLNYRTSNINESLAGS